MGVAENIDMFSFYAAALVLGSVNDSVDHDLSSERNDPWIYGNCMVGPGNGTCKGTVDRRPFAAADPAFAVAGQAERTKRFQMKVAAARIGCQDGRIFGDLCNGSAICRLFVLKRIRQFFTLNVSFDIVSASGWEDQSISAEKPQ